MTRQEILTQIEKLDKGINNSLVADSLKSQMKDKKAELQKQLDELKKIEQAEKIAEAKTTKTVTEKKKKSVAKKTAVAKKQAVKNNVKKTIAEAKSILDSLPKKVKEFNKGRSQEDIADDARKKALPRGKRISADGNVYYENRPNRSDVSTKRKPYLERGGEIDSLNLNTNEKIILNAVYLSRIDGIKGQINYFKSGDTRYFDEQVRGNKQQEISNLESKIEQVKDDIKFLSDEGYPFDLTNEYDAKRFLQDLNDLVRTNQGRYMFSEDNPNSDNLYKSYEDVYFKLEKIVEDKYGDIFAKGGKLSNKGAYLNEPQSKTYTRYEDSKESNRAKPAGWRYTNAGAKRLKLKNPNQLVAKAHLERYRDRYFTDSKGVKHRYIYIERRADKSDVKRGFPYLEKGGYLSNEMYAELDKINDWSVVREEKFKDKDIYLTLSKSNGYYKVSITADGKLVPKTNIYFTNKQDAENNFNEKIKKHFEKGGSIPNNYEGKTPEQVWNEWSVEQKKHFILDHWSYETHGIEALGGKNPKEIAEDDYKNIPVIIRKELEYHISKGQYAKGGEVTYFGGQTGGAKSNAILSFSKIDYDVNVDLQSFQVDVNINEDGNDSVNHYALNETGAGWKQHRWGYMIYPENVEQLYDVLKALKTNVSKNRLNNYFNNGVYEKGGLFGESQYNTGRSWHQDRAKHNKSEDWEKPLSERKGYEDGGELSNMEIAETALKVYVKTSKKEGKALFKQGDAICVVYDDGNTDWVGENDILKMEEGSIDAELPIDELKSQNIDIFGYETQNFDVSEHASSEFLKAISELSDESDFAKESLSKAAKHLDSILLKVKLKEEALSDVAERAMIKTILNDVQLFGYNNYASGLKISIDLISNICADIFELDIDSSNVYEYGGKMYGLGGLTVGNWYRDSSGEELRYIGKNDVTGELIFSDGTKRVTRTEQDFEGKKPKQSKLFGWFEDGGSIEKGNYEMLMSNVKAIKHHAAELENVVKADSEIEAWVVSKSERAATDLSDITHYLDGAEFECGGEMYAKGGKAIKEIDLPNSNLYLYGFGRDTNGNSTIKVGIGGNRPFSIQINNPEFYVHTYNKRGYKLNELEEGDILGIEKELVEYLKENGTKEQKSKLKIYSNFEKGGKPTFNDKVKAIANKLEGEKVQKHKLKY